MPTTYAHDLFGKMVYRQLPASLQQLIRENGELYRIGVHGPDILILLYGYAESGDSERCFHGTGRRLPVFLRQG